MGSPSQTWLSNFHFSLSNSQQVLTETQDPLSIVVALVYPSLDQERRIGKEGRIRYLLMQNFPQLQEKKVFICLHLIRGRWHFCQIDLMLGKCLQTALCGEMESPSSPLTNLAYTQSLETAFSKCSAEKVIFIHVSVKVAVCHSLCMYLLSKRGFLLFPSQKSFLPYLPRSVGRDNMKIKWCI